MGINYEYFCESCQHVSVGNYLSSERPSTLACEECNGTAEYRISMPQIMKVALPDGTRRKGFAELKEASKLNKLASAATDETKREIKKEIRKLGVRTEQ